MIYQIVALLLPLTVCHFLEAEEIKDVLSSRRVKF
jgi:hypothetical protein